MLFHLDSLHIAKTYGGCYEGLPTVAQSIDVARRNAARYFGEDRPTLVLDPKIGDHGKLPAWQFIGWFDGPAKDARFCGAHLVVIWWGDESTFVLPQVIRDLDWDAHAEDYDI